MAGVLQCKLFTTDANACSFDLMCSVLFNCSMVGRKGEECICCFLYLTRQSIPPQKHQLPQISGTSQSGIMGAEWILQNIFVSAPPSEPQGQFSGLRVGCICEQLAGGGKSSPQSRPSWTAGGAPRQYCLCLQNLASPPPASWRNVLTTKQSFWGSLQQHCEKSSLSKSGSTTDLSKPGLSLLWVTFCS